MLSEVVGEAARRFSDLPAFETAAGWTVSYRQLDQQSDAVARGLRRRGIGPGSLVALVLPSTPDYVILYLAAAKLGAITTGVNPRLTARERSRVIDQAAPDLTIATSTLSAGLAADLFVELLEPASSPEALGRLLAESGQRASDDDIPVRALPPDPDQPVALVWTSGTTGIPKGAVFTNRELAAIAQRDIGGQWGTGGPQLASTQFAHVGFMTKLPWYLMGGGTTYLLDTWRAADALAKVARHHMSSIGGVAPQVALMLRVPEFESYDFSSVKSIIMGGGPSSPSLVTEARQRFDAAYSIRYSSTESGGIGTATAFDADDEEALYTVGRPRPGVSIRLVDRSGTGDEVEPGDVGEITLRSETQMRGYWRDPHNTSITLVDGWIRSGDLGYLDERGLLRLAGRLKEMFVRGGYNVYPLEIEGVLSGHPAVREVIICPRPDEVMGDIGVAVVVPNDPAAPPSLADLRSYGEQQLAAYKLPQDLRLVDQLPLTAMQKVDRAVLADYERNRQILDAEPA